MSESVQAVVSAACERCGKDPTRLMDVAWEVQRKLRHVPAEAIDAIAKELGLARVDVQSLVSFYAFLSEEPKGEIVIRLSDDIVDVMHGYERVKQAFEEELGISVGETTPDGKFTLERTACVGLSDQAPAALINEVPVIHLDGEKARDIVRDLREHGDPHKLVREYGDGENAHELVKSMVHNNLRKVGPIIFRARYHGGHGVRLRYPRPDGGRGLYLRRGRRADQSCEGLPGEPKTRPPYPVTSRLSRLSDHRQQRGDLLPCRAHPRPRGQSGSSTWAWRAATARSSSACRAIASIPGSTNCPTV
jgi:NADH:ubiquinone oxidoreductase subunit E